MEQAPYGMQTQSYPKGGLLDGLCPSSSAPGTLGPEQDFQMFPKARISTVSVNYCSIGQDFPATSLNLLSSASGKTQAPECASRWGWGCDFPGPPEFLNQLAHALPLGEVKDWTAGTRPQQRCSASLLLTCLRLWSGAGGCWGTSRVPAPVARVLHPPSGLLGEAV